MVQVVNLEFDLINLRNELDVTPDGAAKDKIEKVRSTDVVCGLRSGRWC